MIPHPDEDRCEEILEVHMQLLHFQAVTLYIASVDHLLMEAMERITLRVQTTNRMGKTLSRRPGCNELIIIMEEELEYLTTEEKHRLKVRTDTVLCI